MAVRIHYRHGLLHSLNRQKHFFSPFKFTIEVHTKWTSHSVTQVTKTNCLALPPFRKHVSPGGGPSLFSLDNGFNNWRQHQSFTQKTQREGEQACPYADGIFHRHTKHWGGGALLLLLLWKVVVYTHRRTYRWGGNRGMVNYRCISRLPAFSNSFLRLNSCNFY